MSQSPASTSASTPPTESIDPTATSFPPVTAPPYVHLTPSSHRPPTHRPTNPAFNTFNSHPDFDRSYLDAAEAELLEEIQLVQTKLTESRHRNALRRNRRLLRRNPSVSDSMFQLEQRNSSDLYYKYGNKSRPSMPEHPSDRTPRARIICVSFRMPKKEHRESARQQLFDSRLPPKALFSVQASSACPFVWVGAIESSTDETANFENVYGKEHRTAWRSGHISESDTRKRKKSRYVPVVLPDDPELLANYDVFCEEILWPLLHYDYDAVGPSDSDQFWNAYRYVNKRFAEAISEIYQEGDLIWIHDYHLMLLPSILRESLWYAKIGFFLYTPFPSAEIFRVFPWRSALLHGVIGADLIGFHSYDYSKQFVASCTRLLGLDGNPNWIEADPRTGRKCELGIYPSGIDVRALKNHVSSKTVKSRIAELRARFEGLKIVVAIDRLDETFGGIPLKLLAYEQLLTKYPELKGKVVLIEVAMLPNEGRSVASYRVQQMQVNELVGRINSSFGTFAFSPVHYINTEIPPSEVHALMSVGHVCVVSTVRDGMSLIPHEWTICQYGGYKGPIVLSEFAGAAHSFSTALHVNPWNVDEMAAKIKVALDMDVVSRNTRNEAAHRFVTNHTAAQWGLNFLEDLDLAHGAYEGVGIAATPMIDVGLVRQGYLGSSTQPSPVSSSNVLSTLGSTLHHSGLPPRAGGEIGTSPVGNPFILSQRLSGTFPEKKEGRFSDGPPVHNGDLMINQIIPSPEKNDTVSRYSPDLLKNAKKRTKCNLLVLDLDGTLTPFQAISKLAAPTPQVIEVLKELKAASVCNIILVISSRDRITVSQWLEDVDVFLAAEDGAYLRPPGGTWRPLFRDTSGQNYLLHHTSSGQFSNGSADGFDPASVAMEIPINTVGKPDQHPDTNMHVEPNDRPQESINKTRAKQATLETTGTAQKGSSQSIIALSNDTSINSESTAPDWKSQVLPVMQHFAERTPGVVIEEGDASLTWSFVDADTDFGRWQARDLYKNLESFLLQRQNIDFVMDEGRRRWIKVRPHGVDKTLAVIKTLEYIRDSSNSKDWQSDATAEENSTKFIDFVLCIGDDRADEDMFEFFRDQKRLEENGVHCIPTKIFTCRVGSSATSATYCIESSQKVLELLEDLSLSKAPEI